ncbi:hypothetical protein B0I37DRAFT_20311 [Chaetomium sp. MPI-CAGE-AT-0009]|nr:hypothetical protein B0I37DRAFT_20311 [Chaetomium sp. MPI-CAGE-AT-0009]
MAILLILPREIRDRILQDAIFIQHPLPASPSVSQDRIRLRNTRDQFWHPKTNIYIQRGRGDKTQLSLLRTNRQLRTETEELLKRLLETTPCRLDVMFVNGCGLFPTWLSLPGLQRVINTVHVQVRIFDAPKDMNPEWLEAASFNHSDGSMRTLWNMLFLLTEYLLNGIDDLPTLYDRNAAEAPGMSYTDPVSEFDPGATARYSIQTLILDVLAPSLDPPPATPDSEASDFDFEEQHAQLAVFGGAIFQQSDERVRENWPVGEEAGDHQINYARKLALGFREGITLAAGAAIRCYQLYGQLLSESIGAIEIRVNGVPWETIDMTAKLCGRFPSGDVSSRYAVWYKTAVAKRKRDGLWNEREYERLSSLWEGLFIDDE